MTFVPHVCYVTERGHLASKNINQFTADVLPSPGAVVEKADVETRDITKKHNQKMILTSSVETAERIKLVFSMGAFFGDPCVVFFVIN